MWKAKRADEAEERVLFVFNSSISSSRRRSY